MQCNTVHLQCVALDFRQHVDFIVFLRCSLFSHWRNIVEIALSFTTVFRQCMQHAAMRCNTLQCTATHCFALSFTTVFRQPALPRWVCCKLHLQGLALDFDGVSKWGFKSALQCIAVCHRVLQCSAVCCSALQWVAVHCSVLHCIAACCSALQRVAAHCSVLQCIAVCCSALQRVAVCCRVLQCASQWVAVVCTVLQSIAVHCSALHCVAVHCNVLQCIVVCCRVPYRNLPRVISERFQEMTYIYMHIHVLRIYVVHSYIPTNVYILHIYTYI